MAAETKPEDVREKVETILRNRIYLQTIDTESRVVGYEDAADAILAALASAPPAPVESGWRDIATAPRDGTEFQAWWKGQWQPRARFDPEYGSFQLWGRTDFDIEGWEVFDIEGHWMPAPEAPTAAQDEVKP